ncbi:MAG: hypothetical protein KDI19_13720, partial [Pseudomonadales bacterium]|nr:hypothetical protein [Pseudomonadales bacterium]
LLAIVVAKAISVSVFEVPILLRSLRGVDPQLSLDQGLRDGSGDRGTAIGYGVGAILWFLAM